MLPAAELPAAAKTHTQCSRQNPGRKSLANPIKIWFTLSFKLTASSISENLTNVDSPKQCLQGLSELGLGIPSRSAGMLTSLPDVTTNRAWAKQPGATATSDLCHLQGAICTTFTGWGVPGSKDPRHFRHHVVLNHLRSGIQKSLLQTSNGKWFLRSLNSTSTWIKRQLCGADPGKNTSSICHRKSLQQYKLAMNPCLSLCRRFIGRNIYLE